MLAVALSILSLAQADPEAAVPVQPRWSVRPQVTPSSRLVRSGLDTASATIRCWALPDGRVEDCRVTAEAPARSGLGQQLVEAAREARIDPDSLGPGDGAWVSFSARFLLD